MKNIESVLDMLYDIDKKYHKINEIISTNYRFSHDATPYDIELIQKSILDFQKMFAKIEDVYITDSFIRDIKMKILNMERLKTKKEVEVFQLLTHLDMFNEGTDYTLHANNSSDGTYELHIYDKPYRLLETFKEYDYIRVVIKHFEVKHSITILTVRDVDTELPF